MSSHNGKSLAAGEYKGSGKRQRGVLHTTCTSGVPILKPSTANVCILLINTEVYIGNSLSEPDGGYDPRNTRANYDNSERTSFVNRAFFDDPFVLCWQGFSRVVVVAAAT